MDFACVRTVDGSAQADVEPIIDNNNNLGMLSEYRLSLYS